MERKKKLSWLLNFFDKTKSRVVSFAQKLLIAGGRVPACHCVMWWGLSPDVSGVTCVCIYLCVRVIMWDNNSGNSFSFQRPRIHINCTAIPKKDSDDVKPTFTADLIKAAWKQCWRDKWELMRVKRTCACLYVLSFSSAAFSFCSTTYVVRMLSFGYNWSSLHHYLF